jgi:hypothetical protein
MKGIITESTKTPAQDALDNKVSASGISDEEIQYVIPLEFALSTTEHTMAYLFIDYAYDYS